MKNLIKIISWNVNGIRAIEKKGFCEWLKNTGPDILCLQEIKADEEQVPASIRGLNGYTGFWNSAQKKGYSGVAVLVKKPPLEVMRGIGCDEFDSEGRVLTLEYPDYYVSSVYFPNAQDELKRLDYKLAFNEQVHRFYSRLQTKKNVIICGDYNVAHEEIDLANPKANMNNAGFSLPERKWMTRFLADGFVDTFRLFCKDPGRYSWWTYRFNARVKNIGWRIDYVCVNKNMTPRLKEAFIMEGVYGSDHCPVGVLLKSDD